MAELFVLLMLQLLALITAKTITFQDGNMVHMLSRGRQHVVDVGDDLELECEFYAEVFNLFDFPILWRKVQHHDNVQVNMMGNVLEPLASTQRLRVSFVPQSPRYTMTLMGSNLVLEDSGNYTCDVNGPHNTLLASITYNVYVRVPAKELIVRNDNRTSTRHQEILTFVENQPGTLRCLALGSFPTARLSVHINNADLTDQLDVRHSVKVDGYKGLRRTLFDTEMWTHNFVAQPEDDGKVIRCQSSVAGSTLNATSALLNVHYSPIIRCFRSVAFVGDRNVFVRCQVRSKPWVSAMYWVLDINGTTVSQGEVNSDYWTLVTDKNNGLLETHLYMRQAKLESFRSYTLIAENSIAISKKEVKLEQMYGYSSSTLATEARKRYAEQFGTRNDHVRHIVGSGQPTSPTTSLIIIGLLYLLYYS